jgi:hypothetical protein
VSDVKIAVDVAAGYVGGKILWELALAGAHRVGRLSVRLVMRLARQGPPTDNSGENSGMSEESSLLLTGAKTGAK